MDAAPQLVSCGIEPLRRGFPIHHPFSNGAYRVRRRSYPLVVAVATEPKPPRASSSKSASSSSIKVNGSSTSPPLTKPVNGVSTRIGDVSKEIKRVRAQMEENEDVAILMRGLRGQNLKDSLFAEDNVELRLVEVDESSEFLPVVYDPKSISAYWGKRPLAVATRTVQLLSVGGGFLSRIISDVIKKKVKENEVARALS